MKHWIRSIDGHATASASAISFKGRNHIFSLRQNSVGASLLAKVVDQPTVWSTDTPSSRAGSLPQVLRGVYQNA
ncbi:hypothetical protein F7R05_26910 [Pseudomonas koreensis]|nr:hypothetical protein F7R05_26910 [Pseudomonas koreensis]